jgi:hypothetical protein
VVLEETLENKSCGCYCPGTQTIILAETCSSLSIESFVPFRPFESFVHFRLFEAIIHEIGHHVQAKTIDFGHELPFWEGADHEEFAKTFTYVYLDKMFLNRSSLGIELYGSPYAYSPAAKRLATMRSILFCDSSPF